MKFHVVNRRNYLIVTLINIFLIGCNLSDKKNSVNDIKQDETFFLKEDTLIRNVKFAMYCIYADSKFAFVKDSTTLINYSECNLKVDTISRFSDTLELGIHFYYKDKQVNFNEIVENGITKIGRVLYDTAQNKIVQYVTSEYLGITIGDRKSRFFNPLQPDVIEYIKSNREKLNPWFKEEAKRRRII